MGKRVAGIAYVKADGEQFSVAGQIECPMMPVKRETVMAVDGAAGYKETAQEPYIKGKFNFVAGFPIDKLQTADAMTVTAEFPNGSVYTLSDAWVNGEPAPNSDDGTIELEFGGMKGQWQ